MVSRLEKSRKRKIVGWCKCGLKDTELHTRCQDCGSLFRDFQGKNMISIIRRVRDE